MSPWPNALASTGWMAAAAIIVAFAVDAWWGEPRARWHPVVWTGRYLDWVGRGLAPAVDAPRPRPCMVTFGFGALAWLIGALVVGLVAGVLQQGVQQLPWWIGCVVLGLLLKPLMAWNMLRSEVSAVEVALHQSLAQGRQRLAWLCSRNVSQLSATQVRETAIETLAENLNDSVVAPIFWFVVLGLPGAALYRFSNTADAMWGYPGPRHGRNWAWAGKWAAHADDVLSWLPARLTALLITLLARGLPFATLRHEARRTPSPNGGWPMAAMALALDVRLGKPGVYTLHAQARSPLAVDTHKALQLAGRAAWAAAVLAALSTLVLGVFP